MHRTVGTYHSTAIGGETVSALVPLPPAPALDLSGAHQLLLERAAVAV